ncbi:solute carrier family 23 member 3 isoform X2 [Orcinus orca]|uniref:solute carrier family 23 member 3 isoform X2 n=1 Tax=Orcinus orca TaxID=9733 RepID=UPI002110FBA9|nr:solute carrier family 23 member 3 isoform X2 [Orcinus orca]
MSRSPPNAIQLRSVGSQGTMASLPQPSAVQNPSSHSWASVCGSPPWGLSCLLALQHILVLASLLCASHLLLLQCLPAGGLSSSPAQLLASSLFSCGVSTALQTWMGSRLPLIQAPSLEFLIPGLVLTSQKLPLTTRTPGNSSLVLRLCGGPGCHGLELWNTSLREVSVWGRGGLRAAAGHAGAVRGSWPLVPPLWAPGAGPQPSCGRALGPQGGSPVLLCSLGPGIAAYPAHGGLFSAPGRPPVPASPLEASFNLFNPHSHPCLQAPLGMWRSGQGQLKLEGLARNARSAPYLLVSVYPSKASLKSSGGGVLFRLSLVPQVLIPVACVWIISALLGLSITPWELSAEAPWFWLPHPAEWDWPLLTPRALAAGISMALAASTSSLGCYALCGQLLHLPSPPPHACSRGLSLEGLGSVLAGLLGSPMGTASSFPNVGTVSLLQAGSRRVAHLVGLLCVVLGLSPRLVQLFTTIPLPVLGGVLGVTQAVVLSTGFSSFHLADIDSGRNVFIVGFSIFMALLLPRWFREAPVLLSTGWSPLDVLLRSLLTEPIFLAGLLGFLLENTIPGTQLERGLGQGLPSSFTAQEVRMPQKSREKPAQEYELPFSIQNLCPCIPHPLRCLCPLPEDSGNEEGVPSEPGETADLLPGFGEQCPGSSREELRSQ